MTARTVTLARPLLGATLPFALPIGLSAFLLFSVEPLVGRLVLPVFGGTAAVWATVLFFFQGVLLVGYLYGHLSVTRLGSWGPPLHLALAALAVVALVIAPARMGDLRSRRRSAGPRPHPDPVRRHRAARPRADDHDPAREWLVRGRARTRSRGRCLLAVRAEQRRLAARAGRLPLADRAAPRAHRPARGLGRRLRRARRAARGRRVACHPGPSVADATVAPKRPTHAAAGGDRCRTRRLARRARWLLLAAVPSGLLSAVTMFIATDLVSAPLLWVAPLSLYLVSFIIAFSPRGGRWVRVRRSPPRP